MNRQQHPILNSDFSEVVQYDYDGFPIYLRKAFLSWSEDYRFDAHFHQDWEFVITLEGCMQYAVDGEIVNIPEGKGIFVNSGHIHFGFSDKREECEYIVLLVHPSFYCGNQLIANNYTVPIMEDASIPYAILEKSSRTNMNLREIYKLKVNTGSDCLLGMQTLLFDIFDELYSIKTASSATAIYKKNFAEMKAMLEFVTVHYSEKISLADIAAVASMSKNNCILTFRRYVGDTPLGYLTGYRIQKSMSLLRDTDMSVLEIAYAVGFSGPSYFAETFRRLNGMSPMEYRTK